MDAVMAMRKQVNEYLPDNEKLSVNDFILKAVALTLREFPNLNASFAGNKVVRHGAVNVGVAVTVPDGLMTVVVKDTDQKPLRADLRGCKAHGAARARRKGQARRYRWLDFLHSNLGMYDVENFIAIINPPEAAILAIGSASEVPVVDNGEIKAGLAHESHHFRRPPCQRWSRGSAVHASAGEVLEEPLRLLV